MKETIKYLILLLLSANLYGQPTLERKTITEALNYTGDKSAVKKLIITDSIAGSDYSEGSEWRLFRTLDEVFENIEEIELHTSQDIPNYHTININDSTYYIGLFCLFPSGANNNNGPYYPALWLKSFSAPNIKRVGNVNFFRCENLLEANIPAAEIIGMGAFSDCKKLSSINISNAKIIEHAAFIMCDIEHINCFQVEEIGWVAFAGCINLVSVNFNNDISEQTTIKFGMSVFGGTISDDEPLAQLILTPNIELTIGNVLPEPDTVFNTWHRTYEYGNDVEYVWKKINFLGIKENERFDDNIFCIGNNIYVLKNVEHAELFDLLGKKIASFKDVQIIDLNDYNLSIGFYFIKIIDNDKIKIKKIIVN